MMRIGLYGVGFMGWIHYLASQRSTSAEIVAFCSRSESKRSGDWSMIRGNFGPPGEKIDVSSMNVYRDYEQLLQDDSVDVVDICLPPNLHEQACIAAFESGKHVLCEKPLSLDLASCDRILESAERTNKKLFVAQVLPYFPAYQGLIERAKKGEFGQLLGGYFKRTISDPTWIPDFYNPSTVGGPLIDLFVHDAHLIGILFGSPANVQCVGRRKEDVPKFVQGIFEYDDPAISVAFSTGVIDQQGRPFSHAFEVHCEQATLHYDLGAFADQSEEMPFKILHADGSVERPALSGRDEIDAFVCELDEVARCLASKCDSPVLSGQAARNAIAICQQVDNSLKK